MHEDLERVKLLARDLRDGKEFPRSPRATLAGYVLGNTVPDIEKRIHYVVFAVIAVSLLPPAIAWFRRRRS